MGEWVIDKLLLMLLCFAFTAIVAVIRMYCFGNFSWAETRRFIVISYIAIVLFFAVYYGVLKHS
jgi:L-cystine uptake protein TcyP (sodium:dicarboxylate symporter family)